MNEKYAFWIAVAVAAVVIWFVWWLNL